MYMVCCGYYSANKIHSMNTNVFQGDRAPPGSPWPKPQVWQSSTNLKTIDPENFLFASSANCDVILQAFGRYGNWMFIDPEASADGDLPGISLLYINLRGCQGGHPREDMDEYCVHFDFFLYTSGSSACTLVKIYKQMISTSHEQINWLRDKFPCL